MSMAIGASSNLVAFGINKGLQQVGILPRTSTTIANDNLGFDFVVETSTEVLRTPINSPVSFSNYIYYGSGKEIIIGSSFNIINEWLNEVSK